MSEAKLCYSIGEHGVLNDLQDDVHSEFLPRLCGLQQGGLHTGNQDWVVWETWTKTAFPNLASSLTLVLTVLSRQIFLWGHCALWFVLGGCTLIVWGFDHFSAPKRQTTGGCPLLFDSPRSLFHGWMWCLLRQGWSRLVQQLVLNKAKWTFRATCIAGLFIPLKKLGALVWVGCSRSIYFVFDLELQGEMHVRTRSVNFVSGQYLSSSVVTLSGVLPYQNWTVTVNFSISFQSKPFKKHWKKNPKLCNFWFCAVLKLKAIYIANATLHLSCVCSWVGVRGSLSSKKAIHAKLSEGFHFWTAFSYCSSTHALQPDTLRFGTKAVAVGSGLLSFRCTPLSWQATVAWEPCTRFGKGNRSTYQTMNPLHSTLRCPIELLVIDSYHNCSGKPLSFDCYSQTCLLRLLSCFCLVWISNVAEKCCWFLLTLSLWLPLKW